MRDLSAFGDATFDVVFHPISNVFVPDLAAVWRECFRVLRPGGTLLAGFLNPDVYLFDHEALDERGELIVVHKLPYSDVTRYSAEERAAKFGADALLNTATPSPTRSAGNSPRVRPHRLRGSAAPVRRIRPIHVELFRDAGGQAGLTQLLAEG
ncbi:methyltransferase domain-containing protein [Streptomyces sp. M19]